MSWWTLLLLITAAASAQEHYVPSSVSPPKLAREMRGVWVASVGNIDWPSTNALTTAQQKTELVTLLNRAVELNFNTVILQVRPACDALYSSQIEPWSEYLTGLMGKPPQPFYDPLAFAIEEAHRRGLELHAWFNPYRARHLQAKSPVAANHVSRIHPDWVRHYGNDLWLDPGEKGVQQYSLNVVMDVVNRYDVDGVHFDDYFYPYPEHTSAGKDIEFPDDLSWRRFGAGGKLSRDDWRRENINAFVHQVYQSIKAAKPWVKFGISPFGIWRPGNPPQIKGLDAFAELHADSRKWLVNGWVDYLAPQLYWGVNPPETSFPALLRWWSDQNSRQRLLCPGLCSNNVGGKWRPEEIIKQIELTRREPGVSGQVQWGMRALMRNGPLDAALRKTVYPTPALVPEMPWLERTPPRGPELHAEPGGARLKIAWAAAGQNVRCWVLQTRKNGNWETEILARQNGSILLPVAGLEVIALSSLDRFGIASPPSVLERKK
ncbi:MAG TPA: family 10 glycosylhydrolase [Verrucomicrobiae bacterium]|nr:family 10 glycosylhydrolase [Verrucomicrobiae bacterium]